MPRIWSTMSPAPLVAIELSPGSPTRCRASRSAWAYVRRRDAHPLGQRPEPIQPVHRGVLADARTGRRGRADVGSVVDDVAARHRVDGDQADRDRRPGTARCAPGRRGRRAGWSRNRPPTAACRDGRPVASEPARSSSISRTGVVPPGAPAASRGRSASGHIMVSRTGLDVSGGTTAASTSVDESAARVGRHPDHRQQEAGIVETGGCAVVGGAVGVDQQPGTRRAARYRATAARPSATGTPG